MRLIDADEFKKQIAVMAILNNYPTDKANKMCELIDSQPAAYDVDKVVERLEENAEYFQSEADGLSQVGNWGTAADLEGRAKAYKNAVEIVKSGSIE